MAVQLQAIYIGHVAQQALEQMARRASAGGSVLGITRQGAFLQFGVDWVVILAQEAWRGPLTVN